MTVRFTRDQVRAGVLLDVAETLALEPEEVSIEHNFYYDLGGESIDMIDLGFRCERRFGQKSQLARVNDGGKWRFEDGRLAEETVRWLQSELPGVDWPARVGTIPAQSYKDLFTLDLIAEVFYAGQTCTSATNASASTR